MDKVSIGRDKWVNIFKEQTQDYYLAILKTFTDIFNKMNVLQKHHAVKIVPDAKDYVLYHFITVKL